MQVQKSPMNTQMMKVSDLKPYPKNPRVNDSAVDRVAKSISDYGFRQPVVIDKEGVIIVGHTRVKAAIKLGLETVPAHVAADMTPEQARAYRIADNKLNELATWDKDLLPLELADLKGMDVDLNGLGFTDADLESILGQGGSGKDGECDPDDVPDKVEPITKPGDLWLLGEHRVLCGDSTKADDVARVLDGRTPFIMVTDPPYGVEYDASWRQDYDQFERHSVGKVENDERVDWTETYKHFMGHVAYVWHAGRFAADLVVNLRDAGFDIRTQIVWRKQHFAMSRGHYHWQHEPCWYAVRSGGSAKWCGDRTQSTIWDIANKNPMGGKQDDANTTHGTQKPVECMERPIRNHGGKDDDVYDPFLGSGTTVIAAERQGRRCYGIEISPAYVDIIVARWEKFTGKKAELSNAIGTQAVTNGPKIDSRKHGKAKAKPTRAKAGSRNARVSVVARR